MNKWKKYLSVLLAILFIAAGTVLVASATNAPGSSTFDEASTDEPIETDPTEEPTASDVTETDAGNIDSDTTDDGNSDGNSDGSWSTNEFSNWDDYAGDGTKIVDSGNVDPLSNTKDASESDVAAQTWAGDISFDDNTLKEYQEIGASGSFKELQKTSENPSEETDDGGWILWLGFGLIALALLCILYFVFATINAKKQAERERRHNAGSHGSGGSRGSGDSGSSGSSRTAERRSSAQRSGGHYADGYEASTRRGSKANTGEIYVPRRATK